MKVFLSYAHEDRDRVAVLAAELKRAGFTVWWDRMISPGAEYARDLENELDAADVVMVAWSRHSIGSHWVRDEAGVGRDRKVLIPVLLDAIEPPLGFRQFQAIDLSSWHGGASSAIAECVDVLRRKSSGEAATAIPKARLIPSRRWLRPATIAILALATLAAAVVTFVALRGSRVSAPAADASIAVLPFTDLSAQHDQQYFSDGIAEELLNVLAKVGGLKVASRTSSFRFRGSELGAKAIADELQVRHLLEGSVRKAGDRVRITAQLIDAADDRHLWSDAYDRPLTAENAFEIQEEIANSVVRELTPRIGPAAEGALSIRIDTTNIEAYELYLKGRALFTLRGIENLAAAAQALEQSTLLDPRFARAWETLAMTYAVSGSWGLTGRDYQRLAFDAADRSEQLDPQLSTPYAVRGSLLFDMIGLGESDDWQASLANLDEAIARDPKNASAWYWRGLDFLALGYFDRGIADLGQCLEVDPAYAYCGKMLALAHLLAGDEAKAIHFYERSKEAVLSTEAVFAAAYTARGELSAADEILAKVYRDAPPELVPALHGALTNASFSEAERAAALAAMDKATRPFRGKAAARFLLGDYSLVPNSINSLLWWYRGDAMYVKSAQRKAHMVGFHLPEYWRAHEFPPQCRPVGANDFQCD